MSITMPETIAYGKVVGRFIKAVGDLDDVDDLPDVLPIQGNVTLTPAVPLSKEITVDPPTTVVRTAITCALNDQGLLTAPSGVVGVWLVAGVYKVVYSTQGASIPSHDIVVLPEHTLLNPLDLTIAMPPGGPVLTPSQYAELSSRIDALEIGGAAGVTSVNTLTGDVVLTPGTVGAAAAVHNHAAADITSGTISSSRLPVASIAAPGIIEVATTAETTTGTDTARAATPAGVKAVADTKAALAHTHVFADLAGVASEAQGTKADTASQPGHAHAATDLTSGTVAAARLPVASATASGIVELATTAEATTGTDTTRAVTAAGVKAVGDTKATSAQGAKADTALQPATPQLINAQTGTAYTLAASDANQMVSLNNAASITLTVPSGTFSAGQRVDIYVLGAGMVTVVGSGVTVTPEADMSLISAVQGSAFTIYFLSATVARVTGRMAPA